LIGLQIFKVPLEEKIELNQVKRKHGRFGLQTVKANTYEEGTYELRSEMVHFCKKKY
jgi:hypothetical protein